MTEDYNQSKSATPVPMENHPLSDIMDITLMLDNRLELVFFNSCYAMLHKQYTGKIPAAKQKAFFNSPADQTGVALMQLCTKALSGVEEHLIITINNKEFRVTAYPLHNVNGNKGLFLIARHILEIPQEVKELFHLPSMFKNVFEHFPLPSTISDYETGKIIDVNELVVKKFETTREDIIGIHSSELFHSAVNRDEYLAFIERDGKVEGMTVQLRNSKGKLIWAEIFSIPIVIDSNKRLLSVIIDVTDKKMSDDKLDYSLKLLETLLNTTNIAILVEDENRNILHANFAFTQMFGVPMPPEQLKGINCNALGSSMVDFFTDGTGFLDRVDQILKQKTPVTDELITCVNGSVLKRSYFPVELKENRKGTLWQYEDVTINIRQQKELIRNKEELQALVTSLDDIIFELDEQLCFINYWCKEDEMLSIPPHEFMGRKITQVFSTLFSPSFFNPFYETLSDGKSRNMQYQIPLNDGSIKWFNAKLNLIKSDQMKQKRLVLTIQDISTRKKAEEDILAALEKEKHLNELKSRFVSMTSHEFKTPLTAIKSSAELIELNTAKMDSNLSGLVLRHVNTINKEVDRLTRLMNDVLILGKIEANKISFNPSDNNLLDLVNEVIERLSYSQSDNRTVKINTKGTERSIFVDPSQMNHILTNLLSNALKYSAGKQEPEISIHWEKDGFSFIVKDYGIGIPEKDLKHIFESFHRATNVKGISGTGLGLVLVKNFVNLHQGKIELKSELNKGTVVSIRIQDLELKNRYEENTHY